VSQAETWTVGRLLKWTTDFLRKHESESPRLDAEVLLAHARGCQRIELYTAFEEEPPEEIKTRFRELVKKRSQGEPVAYLVGSKEFFSLNLP
jgi:release factor glutamine methyltransferase